MKKQIDLQLIAIFGGGLLFNFLFWMERLALNLLLYSLFIFIVLFVDKATPKNKRVLFAAVSHLLAALLVVYNQSVLTIISYYLSLFIFIGFVHMQQLRSVFTALFAAVLQLTIGPINLVKKLIGVKLGRFSLKPIIRPIKYIIIPIIVLIFFSILYSIANPVFAKYLEIIANNIGSFITSVYTFIFGELSVLRFMHIVLGILFTAGIIIKFKDDGLEKAELTLEEKMIRKKRNLKKFSFGYEITAIFAGKLMKKNMALKTENIIGIISFAALNLLILSLNTIDVSTLWLGNVSSIKTVNYSAELHEGTNALIMSIVLAMLVIIYFFSGNLNFFSRNKTIRILAYVWIIQNAFLVSSVLLRDYNYVDMHGLTYKRIGVLVFLILCTIGLITVYIKVAQQKTLFYLFKTNGFVWYSLLLIAGLVNWDVFIVNYNINNRNNITLDLDHLLDMSDKTLPLLDKNRNLLKKYVSQSSYATRYDYTEVVPDTAAIAQVKTPVDTVQLNIERTKRQLKNFDDDLDGRIERFNKQYEETSWLSWNYRDWQTSEYFRFKKKD
ncbi:DUF4173 domain-containing protein [Pedobacter frigiditerrae]|uniref:DUF4173 domain-containing protein n=1 Tax=Pedobacter frigiditerrae TaxID=2530452 RepID=A0A4R0N0K2_9SPHI|nr:DUF4173 domain-containing protein [Pedobacter frigiditerrae]TCC91882.1 DUF4173 domain-containing protein [Pedobacter frigiditerrae]